MKGQKWALAIGAGFLLVLIGVSGFGFAIPPQGHQWGSVQGTILATVDGSPILSAEVLPHLRPAPPRVGGAAPTDPRAEAVDIAISVRLLAREASRRGFQMPENPPALVQASLVQALIKQELAWNDADGDSVGDAEARARFERDPQLSRTAVRVELAAIVVTDAALAELLLREANGASDAAFVRLAAEHSEHAASRARGGALLVIDERREHASGTQPHSDPLERALMGVGLRFRRAGEVGLATGPDGRHYVLRATNVETEKLRWNHQLSLTVANIVRRERTEAVTRRLVERLGRDSRIEIDDAAVAALRLPE